MNGFFAPGFESYNMMNFSSPRYQGFYPNMNTNCQMNNDIDKKIKKLENQIDNLQNRVSRLEGSMYPQAIDYKNMM